MTDMTDSLQRKETSRHQRAIRKKRMQKRLSQEESKGPFKVARCRCGNVYEYIGINFKHCVKCLDDMEKAKKEEGNNEK